MRRREFLGAVTACSASIAGCSAFRAETSPGPLEPVDYSQRGAWPTNGRDSANSSHNPVSGPDESATANVLYDDARHDGAFPLTGPGVPTAQGPAVVDGAVYLQQGVVDATDGTVERSVDLPGEPSVTPAVAHGHVYRTAAEETTAIALDTAERRWTADVVQPIVPVAPAVDADRVYLASGASDEGLVALGAGSGEREWTFPDGIGRPSGVAVTDDRVYVTETGDSSASDGRVTALDPETGEEIWHQSLDRVLVGPVASESGVFVGTASGTLHAVDADGTQRWQKRVVTSRGGFVSSRPALGDDRVFVPSNNGSVTTALDRESGDVEWDRDTGITYGTPAVGETNVYVGTGNDGIQVLSRRSGEVQWTVDAPEVRSDLALLDGRLFYAAGSSVYRVA